MLVYEKGNGEKVVCEPIGSMGAVGQNIVLIGAGSGVLEHYQPPAFFRITEVVDGGEGGYYTLLNEDGVEIQVMWKHGERLYDARAWARWREGQAAEYLRTIVELQKTVRALCGILLRHLPASEPDSYTKVMAWLEGAMREAFADLQDMLSGPECGGHEGSSAE